MHMLASEPDLFGSIMLYSSTRVYIEALVYKKWLVIKQHHCCWQLPLILSITALPWQAFDGKTLHLAMQAESIGLESWARWSDRSAGLLGARVIM